MTTCVIGTKVNTFAEKIQHEEFNFICASKPG